MLGHIAPAGALATFQEALALNAPLAGEGRAPGIDPDAGSSFVEQILATSKNAFCRFGWAGVVFLQRSLKNRL
jgi:hypothetical protein